MNNFTVYFKSKKDMNIFWATKRILITDVRVNLIVHGDTKFLEKIAKKLCSVRILPTLGDGVEVELQYPNYKSASIACRNFAKNKQISYVQIKMDKGYK